MLRYLISAGLEGAQAMGLAARVDRHVRELPGDEVADAEVERYTLSLLRDHHGEGAARRYRLIGALRRSPKPVVIFIGGATGSGKSTLALELAHRLGVRQVTSTDMIREAMRTVLSPQVVPGLHDHSFRGIIQGGQVLSDPRERVLAGFQQQCAQVAVGVRAVVSRALREGTHVIVEGTHIQPPFDAYLDSDAQALSAGCVLAVPEAGQHRERFPRRAAITPARDAGAYLEAFQSVRWIHEDLMERADRWDCAVVSNDEVRRTVASVIEYLSHTLFHATPAPPSHRGPRRPAVAVKTLAVVLDGLGDEPNPALGGRTPLEAAETPFLDALAGLGGLGQVDTSLDGEPPGTHAGTPALLGAGDSADPHAVGRGLIEALGAGVPRAPGAVVLRGNLATVDNDGQILDRRAGRIRAGIEDLLVGLDDVPLVGGVRGRVHASHEHRVVVVLSGPGLSHTVSDTDPGSASPVQRVQPVEALDNSVEAARTRAALEQLLARARAHLRGHPVNAARRARGEFPADAIITRGAASSDRLPAPVAEPGEAAMVAGCRTALGVGRLLGFDPVTTSAMTGNLDTDLDAKFELAAQLLDERDYVVVHCKGTDIAAHDRQPLAKRDYISAADRALGRLLTEHPLLSHGLRVVVSADHGTSSISGDHTSEPVPLLLATWAPDEDPGEFSEATAGQGALGLLGPGELAVILSEGSDD